MLLYQRTWWKSQRRKSWRTAGRYQGCREQSAEPLRKWELGQNKGLNPSVGFQHHRKFAFSPWSKSILCDLCPGQTKWEGPVLCSYRVVSTAGLQIFCKYCKYSWFSQKAARWGFFCRCCCVRAAIWSFKRDGIHWWGQHNVVPLGGGCCSSALSRIWIQGKGFEARGAGCQAAELLF